MGGKQDMEKTNLFLNLLYNATQYHDKKTLFFYSSFPFIGLFQAVDQAY